jgi:hypothetical protein
MNDCLYLYSMNATIKYPQYRKYLNGKSYFKIISSTEWEEIQVIGNKYLLNKFTVKIMPDRNYIHDMTFDYENNWMVIEEEEYELMKRKIS